MSTLQLSGKQVYREIKIILPLVDYQKFKRVYFLSREKKNAIGNAPEVLLVPAGGWSQSVTLPPAALEFMCVALCVVTLFDLRKYIYTQVMIKKKLITHKLPVCKIC